MQSARYAQEYRRKMNGLGVLERGDMLYYNIDMSDHHDHHGHRHHHHPGPVHPPALVHPSILRLSVLQRLGFAGGLIALLWAAAFWAMR
jgi:hypothetical protein